MEKETRYKSMPAENSRKTFEEFDAEGWEQVYSFHDRFVDQWNETADMAQKLKEEGKWEMALAVDNTEGGRRDGVRYLYKREKKSI